MPAAEYGNSIPVRERIFFGAAKSPWGFPRLPPTSDSQRDDGSPSGASAWNLCCIQPKHAHGPDTIQEAEGPQTSLRNSGWFRFIARHRPDASGQSSATARFVLRCESATIGAPSRSIFFIRSGIAKTQNNFDPGSRRTSSGLYTDAAPPQRRSVKQFRRRVFHRGANKRHSPKAAGSENVCGHRKVPASLRKSNVASHKAMPAHRMLFEQEDGYVIAGMWNYRRLIWRAMWRPWNRQIETDG